MRYSLGKYVTKIVAVPTFLVLLVLVSRHHYNYNLSRRQVILDGRKSTTTSKPQEKVEKVAFENENPGDKKEKTTVTHIKLPEWMSRGTSISVTEGNMAAAPVRYHVGVLSSAKYLQSRAIDLYHTWGKEARSMAFYIGNIQTAHWPADLPVTVLKDANDTSYPPQRKGFSLLQYWCNHYLETYDWFIKVDDDSYLKVVFLEKLLSGLDETQMHYFGRSGKGLSHEVNVLGLYGNTFCCGPTVVYSKAVLKGVCPHLDTCLDEVVSKHEDTEIGRCMISKMELQCGISDKSILQSLFYQTYNKEYYKGDLSGNEKFTKAISVHEVKSSQDMYNLHFYYRQTLVNNTIAPSVPKSNPLNIKPSRAKGRVQMCKKVKCEAPIFGTKKKT